MATNYHKLGPRSFPRSFRCPSTRELRGERARNCIPRLARRTWISWPCTYDFYFYFYGLNHRVTKTSYQDDLTVTSSNAESTNPKHKTQKLATLTYSSFWHRYQNHAHQKNDALFFVFVVSIFLNSYFLQLAFSYPVFCSHVHSKYFLGRMMSVFSSDILGFYLATSKTTPSLP